MDRGRKPLSTLVFIENIKKTQISRKKNKKELTGGSKDDSMTKLSFRDSIFENDTVTNSKYYG